jgi:bla regulator protein blaR1
VPPVLAYTPQAPSAGAAPPSSPADAGTSTSGDGSSTIHGDDDQDSYAVISGSRVQGSGDFGPDFAKVRSKVHGDYIWFEHDGKSYVIEDPALVAQAKQLSKPMEELGQQQAELGRQQARLGMEQARLGEMQTHASIPTPDMSKALADATAAMTKLQMEKGPLLSQEELKAIEESIRKMEAQPNISMPDVSKAMEEANAAMKQWNLENKQWMGQADFTAAQEAIQERMAELQSRFGDWESKIGEKQSAIGEQQSELGQQQSKLGEQQSKLGQQQSKLAEENSQKMKTMLNDALRSGKARPVE